MIHVRWLLVSAILLGGCSAGGGDIHLAGPSSQIEGLSAQERALLAQAPGALAAAGCGDVRTIPDYPDDVDRSHIGGPDVATAPPLISYASVPPASGPHNPVPVPAGVYSDPPDVYGTIHSLEHAAVVVWYAPETASAPDQAAELTSLRGFFTAASEADHVIVAPYQYPDQGEAGRLPDGTNMALVAWHRLRLCERVNLAVAFDFIRRFRFDPVHPDRYEGEAPEPGVPIG